MPTVLAGARVGQRIGRRVGQAQRVVQFAVGQQSGIGGNRRTAKLEHQTAVEIEPQSASYPLHPSGPPSPPRLAIGKMLNSKP